MKLDLTGQKFERLFADHFSHLNKWRQSCWVCFCDCDLEKSKPIIVTGSALKNGHTKSCGCLHKERASIRCIKRATTHGLTKHPLYKTWRGFNERCYNSKANGYLDYGDRGIEVCLEWKGEKYGGLSNHRGLLNFLKWCEENPKPIPHTDYSLHRIKGKDSYSPENCKWADWKEQNAPGNLRKRIKNSDLNILLKERDDIIKNLQEENELLREKLNKIEMQF